MDEILVLLGLAVLLVPVTLVILLVGQSRLKRRVSELERSLRALAEGGLAPQGVPVIEPPVAVPAAAPPLPVEPAAVIETASPVAPADTVPSPWDRAVKAWPAEAPPPPDPARQNRPIVLRADRLAALSGWIKTNWVYALSALSLALAGVFFVQYGVENGLLPPAARVMAAILFGAVLIAAGEWLRRRHGDEGAHRSALLPSVFSGAGLVSIFAAVLAARQMYGLIGPEIAFAGHLATAALAVALGWFYGPLLVAMGLLGAAAAPFIVSGGAAAGPWLYAYFALIAAVGLAVDAVRRWAWVSVLALVLGYGGGALVALAGAGTPGLVALLVTLALLAVILPNLQLLPQHDGPATMLALLARGKAGWPNFPVRLAAGALLATAVGLTLLAGAPPGEAMLALAALTGLALAYLIWAEKAEGLADLAYIPSLGLLASLLLQGFGNLPLRAEYLAQAADLRAPEVAPPLTISLLLGLAVVVGAGFAWRSFRAGPLRMGDSVAAVLLAPVTAAALDLLWQPARVIGAYPWALQVMALAALMVALARHYARLDREEHRRFALATLSALSLIALALFSVATSVGLTLALGVLALAAAGLDRRFDLPEMGWFIQAAVAVLGYRLLADPGLDWAFAAPLGAVLLAFVGVIAALVAALRLLPEGRVLPKGVLESAAAGLSAVLANVLITRWLLPQEAFGRLESHWSSSLNALPWLVLMLMQLYRARLGGVLRRPRQAVALVAGLLAAAGLALAVGPFNPLFSYSASNADALVRGPLLLDTLFLAYALPGLILLAAVWRLPGLGRLRLPFLVVGLALLALYAGLEIRRLWQGDWLGRPGVMQGELYSYTIALMLLGAALLMLAIRRRSRLLRRVAMVVIGLTIAKVFILDTAGLNGLMRVASLVGLGLSLAGLAWLNRWAGQVSRPEPPLQQ